MHVIGVNLPPRHWLPLACELAAAEPQNVAQRTAALVLLSALLHAASRAAWPVDEGSLQLAAATLAGPSVAGAAAAADSGPLRQQLLAACSNLLRWAGPAAAPAAPQLFALLLRLWAVEAAAAQEAAAEQPAAPPASASADSLSCAAVLDQLASAVQASSAAELCERYGSALLSRGMQVGMGVEVGMAGVPAEWLVVARTPQSCTGSCFSPTLAQPCRATSSGRTPTPTGARCLRCCASPTPLRLRSCGPRRCPHCSALRRTTSVTPGCGCSCCSCWPCC